MIEARILFPAQTDQLQKLGEFLKRSCDDEAILPLIELAADEVIVNAIRHGDANNCELIVTDNGEFCQLEVIDDGIPFNILEAEPLPMGELREGGYGLGILHAVSQSLSYERRADRNHIKITFNKGAS